MLFRFHDFVLDPAQRRLTRAGAPIAIEPKLLDLVIYMVRNRDRVVPREELLREVWKGVNVGDHTLAQSLHSARRILGDRADKPRTLKTHRGHGISFVAEVRVEGATEPLFVGRAPEMAILRSTLTRVEAGYPQLALVLGEPGVGKSRLLQEFACVGRRELARPVWGRCSQSDGAPAFWPWRQIAGELGGLPKAAGLLETASDLEKAAQRSRFVFFHGVLSDLTEQAKIETTILLMDDLQFADDASIELLTFLCHELRACPLFLVVSARSTCQDLPSKARNAIDLLSSLSETATIQLRGLDRHSVSQLCEATDKNLSAREVDSVFERSGGNPFFATQLLNSACPVGSPHPQSIASAIGARCASLSGDALEALEACAVVGRSASFAVLVRVTAFTLDRAEDAVEECIGAGLLEWSSSQQQAVRFTHDLVREVASHRLRLGQRQDLHSRVSHAYEAQGESSHLAQISYHASQAGPAGTPERAMRFSALAGRHAIARFAYEEAVQHYERYFQAANLCGSTSSKPAQLLAFGVALRCAGRLGEARRILLECAQLANEKRDEDTLSSAALELAPGVLSLEAGEVDPDAVKTLRLALLRVSSEDHGRRALLTSRLAVALVWAKDSFEERHLLIASAIAHARLSAGAEVLAFVRACELVALWTPEAAGTRLEKVDRLLAEISGLEMPALEAVVRVLRITTLTELGERRRRVGEIERLEAVLCAGACPEAQWYSPMYRASLAADSGDWSHLELFAERFVSLGSQFADANLAHSQAALHLVRAFHQGRCRHELGFVRMLQRRFSNFYPWRAVLAFFLLAAGEDREAKAEYHRLMADSGRASRDSIWLLAHCFIAETAIGLGDSEGLPELFESLHPFTHLHAVAGYGVVTWGSVARVVGRLATALGQEGEALRHFDHAVAQERSSGTLLWEGHSLVDRALARGRRIHGERFEDWSEDLARSRSIADRLDAGWLRTRVDRAAEALHLLEPLARPRVGKPGGNGPQ